MKRFLTCALSGVFFIWLPNAFADDNGGLLADTPSHIRQAQGDHKVLLTLRADNIQVRAEWRVTSAVKVFDIHEGKLQTVTTIVAPVTHVATIYAVDRFDLLNASYANLTASAVITVEFVSGDAEKLQLSDAPRLTAVAGKALSLHTFVATGGSEGKTYTLVAGGDGHFVLDEASGVLSLRADAEPDIYTLTVEVADDNSEYGCGDGDGGGVGGVGIVGCAAIYGDCKCGNEFAHFCRQWRDWCTNLYDFDG